MRPTAPPPPRSTRLPLIRKAGLAGALVGLAACDPGDSFIEAPAKQGPQSLAPPGGGTLCGDAIKIDPRRSLAVTDAAILKPFTFTRVMQQIVNTGKAPGLTPTLLYQRWWDFFNQAPGLHPEAQHCDDRIIAGQPALGAFPITCPRPEGVLAATDPFQSPDTNPDAYVPVGLFNRFDLAPVDGSTCGEYRIVFAKRSGMSAPDDRNFIIFEAALPNPKPECGVDGCRAIAQFWADNSAINDPVQLRDRLEHFYFTDAEGAGPVVHADHYGPRGGQIRTNQFMNGPNIWQLHEFTFDPDCGFGACIRATTLKDNPFAELFQDPSPWEGADWFQTWFIRQVPNLEIADANRFFMKEVGTYRAGASTSDGDFDNYRLQSGFSSSFRDAVDAAITTPGVTADNIFNRALALSCSGCHEHANSFENADFGGGVGWQPSLGFVHVSEEFTENGQFGPRFPISDGLSLLFLPHRRQVLETFLAQTACDACNNKPFLPPGVTDPDGMTVGGPRSGH